MIAPLTLSAAHIPRAVAVMARRPYSTIWLCRGVFVIAATWLISRMVLGSSRVPVGSLTKEIIDEGHGVGGSEFIDCGVREDMWRSTANRFTASRMVYPAIMATASRITEFTVLYDCLFDHP